MRIRELPVGVLITFSLAVLAHAPAAAGGATLAVPADFPTIQQAIDAAAPGDIVEIAPGTYFENIRFHGKAITVRGAGADLTTIDGSALTLGPDYGSVVLFFDGEGPDSVLEDLRVTGGTGTPVTPTGASTIYLRGGGILGWGANPTLRRVLVTDNHFAIFGGGAYLKDIPGPLTLVECRFSQNSSSEGGGLLVDGPGELTIEDCEFDANEAFIGGGGATLDPLHLVIRRSRFTNNVATNAGIAGAVYIGGVDPSVNPMTLSALFEDCEFTQNSAAAFGGAFAASITPMTMRRCLFSENSALILAVSATDTLHLLYERCVFRGNSSPDGRTIGGTINLGSITIDHCTFTGENGPAVNAQTSPLTITHSIFWGNSGVPVSPVSIDATVEWSDIEGGYPGTGNIDADPLFVDSPSGDLHLLAGSPCIDAGSPAYRLDPDGSTSDLGAFPFEGFGGFRRGDANTDGGIDIADGVSILLALFGGGFTLECADAADTNDDGAVDAADAIYAFQYQLLGGAPPPPPNDCGEDPTEDGLDCALGPPGC